MSLDGFGNDTPNLDFLIYYSIFYIFFYYLKTGGGGGTCGTIDFLT